MEPNNEGFVYPKIEKNRCIDCNLCREICPTLKTKDIHKNNGFPKAFAAINKNDSIRSKSTSGDIFHLLAKEVIDKNGIVFGVKFDSNFHVIHGSINTIDSIKELRGSKYVQSKIGETYKECKEYLKNGLEVLLSGTPCQIEGLRTYLQKDYDNLIAVDIICMSVPLYCLC
jgi:coenzyme F420-reducing hydrogenase beta subunit